MAWNPLPQSWFTGLTDDGTDITIPIAAFGTELTAEEIDSANGDVRKFIYAFIERCWAKWSSIATADKPSKMTITKTSSIDAATGILTNVYTFTFKNTITAQDVANEV